MPRDIVQSFYEKYPYPHVQRFGKERMEAYAKPLLAAAGMQMRDMRGKKILDVGCGTGEIACSMAMHALDVKGIDFSTNSIAHAQKIARPFGLKNIHFEKADLFEFSPNQKYDIVTCFGVLHHTPNFPNGFRRIAEWVAPGGILLIGFYHPWGGWEQRLQKTIARWMGGESPEKRLEWVEKRQGMRMNHHSQSFWADRIAHPRENYFRVSEIQPLFTKNGFQIIGIQSHKPEWKVERPENPWDILRFEIELFLRRKRFVIMAGTKKESS
mgnify:FL=1